VKTDPKPDKNPALSPNRGGIRKSTQNRQIRDKNHSAERQIPTKALQNVFCSTCLHHEGMILVFDRDLKTKKQEFR